MSTIEIHLLGDSRCQAIHGPTGAELTTDIAPELGGGGSTFSSTDLLAASLGTCVGSSLAPVLRREGIEPGSVAISVAKDLSTDPKRIERLSVEVRLATRASQRQLRKLRAASRSCLVHRSLSPDIDVRIEVSTSRLESGSAAIPD